MADGARWIEAQEGLPALFSVLSGLGYSVHGLVEHDGAIMLAPVETPDDLPRGRVMESEGGRVHCEAGNNERYFDKTLPMQGLKKLVYPSEEVLSRTDAEFNVSGPPLDRQKIAVIGARACDLAALKVLDTVFQNGPYRDTNYAARRKDLLLIAVDCAVPLETCFCASMKTGPHAEDGFDLALTELSNGHGHGFLIRAGSSAGSELLSKLDTRSVDDGMMEAKQQQADAAAGAMIRHMPENAGTVVKESHGSTHWADVASRCLSCANCTMVCPTCFCSTVEDRNALDGSAWRERRWDSCFSLQFSYIHGGVVRGSEEARYRQWMTHKLGHWHDQFGMSGCVGCGRCIAWCPVGIDITAEATALASEFDERAQGDEKKPTAGVA